MPGDQFRFFSPEVRNANIYARWAVDDKGQVYLVLKAIEGWLKTEGKLPVNIELLFECEEESGGEHIEEFVSIHQDKLKADAELICDTELFAPGLPTVTTDLRGIICTEIQCIGLKQDLHSLPTHWVCRWF